MTKHVDDAIGRLRRKRQALQNVKDRYWLLLQKLNSDMQAELDTIEHEYLAQEMSA